MEINVFGPLSVHDGDRRLGPRDFGGAKPKQILELLLLARGRVLSKDSIAESLWPERPPVNVSAAIDTYVCVLRRSLSEDTERARRVVVTGAGTLRLGLEHVHLDVDRFDALVRDAEVAWGVERRGLLEEALRLAQGDLLEDEPYAAWAQEDRMMYRDRIARAHLAAARECLAAAEAAPALRHGESALRISPFSEEGFRIVILANHLLGHDDMARRAFARCRTVLADELGVDPTSETVELASAVDAGVPAVQLLSKPERHVVHLASGDRRRGSADRRRAPMEAVRSQSGSTRFV